CTTSRQRSIICLHSFLHDALPILVETHKVWNRRVSTGRLNRWLERATQAHPPPAVSGRRLKVKYITQIKTRPPGFVLSCSRPEVDRKSTRLNSSHVKISYAVFCLK